MSGNRITSLAAMAISVVYLYLATTIERAAFSDPVGPKAFPFLCGFGLLLSGAVLFLHDAMITKEAPLTFTAFLSGQDGRLWRSPLVVTTITCLIYALTFESLGYPVATALFFMMIVTYLQKKKWIANAVFSISFSLGSYLLFAKILNLSFPLGILRF